MVILGVTNSALAVVVAVVAVIRALAAGQGLLVLLEPGLADTLAGAEQTEVVSRDTNRANLDVEAHIAFPEALSANLGEVIKVPRGCQAPLRVKEYFPMVDR